MARFEDSVLPGDHDFLKENFPDSVFKMFSEKKDAETQPAQKPLYTPQSSISVTKSISFQQTRSSTRRSTRLTAKQKAISDPLDKILSTLKSRKLYNQHLDRWTNWPLTNEGGGLKEEISKYLNRIVDSVLVFLNGGTKPKDEESDWVYSACYHRSPFRCEGTERKPDIAIIQRKHEENLRLESLPWGGIRSFGELNSTLNDGHNVGIGRLAEYARLCFGHEKTRRFILCFTILGDTMQLFKIDRSGIAYSHEFDVHKDPHAFLRVVVGLIIGDAYNLGLDPYFVAEEGKAWVFSGKRYENLLIEGTSREYGTATLLVRRESDGMKLVIRDQWAGRSSMPKKPIMLRKLKTDNLERIANIEDNQVAHFMVKGKKVSTGHIVGKECSVETSKHSKLLISPYGDKLENFRSLKELVSAFKDYVQIIEDLINIDVIHGDISLNNAILVEDKSNPKALRKGHIIDFDNAVIQSQQKSGCAEGNRTMTYPFMSIAVLRGLKRYKETHNYYHDLESLFYVLVWICLTHSGPNGVARSISGLNYGASPIKYMCNIEESSVSAALNKSGMMNSWEGFKDYVFVKMDKYFAPLDVLFYRIREILFRDSPSFPKFVNGTFIVSKSLADIPDDQKSMRDRDHAKIFAEFKGHLNAVLELKEVRNESGLETGREDKPLSELQ